jgi:hypothetical protein
MSGYGRYLRQRKLGEPRALHEDTVEYHTDDETDPFAEAAV